MTGVLGGITSAVTNAIASHGVYAVFGVMALDAVLPLGSELIMVYAGVLAQEPPAARTSRRRLPARIARAYRAAKTII
jgi:hypothetical protein